MSIQKLTCGGPGAPPDSKYEQRKQRYLAALANEKPDMVPIRPFVAEFTARYAGFTCQEVTHDYWKAFEAAVATARDFDWDAVVPNMVYVWTGLTEALGLKYYAVPGVHTGADVGFQYREPSEDDAFMRPDEYDHLIADPNEYLYSVWLPRVAADVPAPGAPATYRGMAALVKASAAMSDYFAAFGPQIQRLRAQCQMPGAIAGILKAPLDILGDKLRGYIGLAMDLQSRPEKVLAACEALMPHLLHTAVESGDASGELPVGFWMHRGCVPFISHRHFESHYWPTVRQIIEELWRRGRRTLMYAEGDWGAHLDAFAQLPEASVVFHCDRTDVAAAHRALGGKFCLSGGVPNAILSYGTAEQVRERVRDVLRTAARDGGYVLDASAIIQNDTTPENMRAFTEAGREFGQYDGQSYCAARCRPEPADLPETHGGASGREPGVCIPWEEKAREMPAISGDRELVKRIWEEVDAFGASFIWQMLVSF